MDLRKILWTLLAGASLAVGGCDDDDGNPPQDVYGPPADYFFEPESDQDDQRDSQEADVPEESEVAADSQGEQ